MSVAGLHVTVAGEGPPVVLLHGLTATHRYVVHGSRALERGGHRVIAYDARGHGRSAPAGRYGYDALADDLLAVLDAYELDRAVLAGASMGAHTLLRLALAHPGRVAGAVVVTPAWTEDRDPDLPGWDRLAAALREGGVDGFVAAYDFSRLAPGVRETVEQVIRRRLGAHEHLGAVADALEQVPRSAPFGGVGALRGLRGFPVTVVADRDEMDPGHPLEVGERYAAVIPDAALVVEAVGESPVAWRGAQLSKVIARVAANGAW